MYRDELEALQARLQTLEAELDSQHRQREAAEAELEVERARARELELTGRRLVGKVPPARPSRLQRPHLLVTLLLGVVCIFCFLGWCSESRHRLEIEERMGLALLDSLPSAVVIDRAGRGAGELPGGAADRPGGTGRAAGQLNRWLRRINAPELTAMQKKHFRALQACYERALARDDTLTEIRLNVELAIGDDGRVVKARVRGKGSEGLIRCLEWVISGWSFPVVGAQSVRFPLILKGK